MEQEGGLPCHLLKVGGLRPSQGEESSSNSVWWRTPFPLVHLLPFFPFFLLCLPLAEIGYWVGLTSLLRAGAPPIGLLGSLPGEWPLPVKPQNPFVTPGTLSAMPKIFLEAKCNNPIYQSSSPDHSRNPRDVRDLIRDFEQNFGHQHL